MQYEKILHRSTFIQCNTVNTWEQYQRICLSTIKFLSVEKQCPVAILFVNIALATVTSSKLNGENSAKAQYVDETHSYRFLKFEIDKS